MSLHGEGTLARFQDAFLSAVLTRRHGALEAAVERAAAQPGFAVYRNTIVKGCVDALQANFPAVRRLVGDEWFHAAATLYARFSLPRTASLLEYGADFPQFLATFPPAAELPYLAAVAQLDRFWTEAHISRDEAPLDPRCITSLRPDDLACRVLRVHASARWAMFDGSAVTIWRRNRYHETVDLGDLVCRPEGVLVVRPGGEVTNVDLDAAACAFVGACAAGENLAGAAARSLAADAECDLAQLMMRLLEAGAFSGLD
jgi:hypothetical protein